jgi:outer membrane protein TolC
MTVTYASPRNFDEFVPKNVAAAGVTVSWEVFDWGRKKRQLAEKQKTIDQTNNSLRDAENTVMIEVGAKMRDLQQAAQTLRVAKLRQETARENMRVSINKYKLVATLFSNVLQTQATLADADYEYQKALLAFWTAKAEYEKAMGADK